MTKRLQDADQVTEFPYGIGGPPTEWDGIAHYLVDIICAIIDSQLQLKSDIELVIEAIRSRYNSRWETAEDKPRERITEPIDPPF
jgi:hypothetical protein